MRDFNVESKFFTFYFLLYLDKFCKDHGPSWSPVGSKRPPSISTNDEVTHGYFTSKGGLIPLEVLELAAKQERELLAKAGGDRRDQRSVPTSVGRVLARPLRLEVVGALGVGEEEARRLKLGGVGARADLDHVW